MAEFPKIDHLSEAQRWRKLIELMSVPGYAHVYVLGCFAKFVTIYSQQVRALNLVDALCKGGVLSARSRVAVVGGGIAGVTAAGGLIASGIRQVALFEKEPSLMRLQRNCQKREVHPHLYEWPLSEGAGDAAGLPILNWEAKLAQEVVTKDLDPKWNEIIAMLSAGWQPRCDTLVDESKLRCLPDGTCVIKTTTGSETFDAVILAVGFGLDGDEGNTETFKPYWTDEDLEHPQGRCFLSGFGDGALTDLMRLCIQDFHHPNVLKAFREAADSRKESLKSLVRESDEQKLSTGFTNAAKNLEPGGVKLRVWPDGSGVFMNCSRQKLFSARSSVLNRLIVAWLLERNAFQMLKPRKLAGSPKWVDPGFEVQFEKPEPPEVFDAVIIRHGPRKPLETLFPDLWDTATDVRAIWNTVRQGEDWTSRPWYADDHFQAAAPTRRLRVDFGGNPGCLFLHQNLPRKAGSAENLVKSAWDRPKTRAELSGLLDKRVEKPAGEPLEFAELVAIPLDTALDSPDAFLRAVRALCEADVAVIDITNFDCAAMLFLGIRSAVRRGVTITVRLSGASTEALEAIPFNLGEINPILIDKNNEAAITALQQSIVAGFRQWKTLPGFYLDLPAYDAVRRLGAKRDQYAPIPREKESLLLCWFNEDYLTECGQNLQSRLKDLYEDSEVITVIDTRSPQLVGQRLYEKIRRCESCLIDWTGWRPNVFFEFGVRIAINSVDPFLFICQRALTAEGAINHEGIGNVSKERAAALRELFQPAVYSANLLPGMEDPMARLKAKQGSLGKLSGTVYETVLECFATEQEVWSVPVEKQLQLDASVLLGEDALDQANLPILYTQILSTDGLETLSANRAKENATKARRAGIERLLAAWFYLERRCEVQKRLETPPFDPHDPLWETVECVGGATHRSVRHRARCGLSAISEISAGDPRAYRKTQESKPMNDEIEQAKRLKSEAMRERDRESPNWDRAVDLLRRAKALLVDALPAELTGPVGPAEKELMLQLANICGSLGGALRSARRYGESVTEYDEGEEYESQKRYGFDSSYNLTQRLVTRVLLEPAWIFKEGERTIQGLAFPKALEDARAEIDRQLGGTRAGDEWAVADRAMIGLLLGEPGNLRDWKRLARIATSAFVFDATVRVLDDVEREFNTIRDAEPEEQRRRDFMQRLTAAKQALSGPSA